MIAIFNWTPNSFTDYKIGVPENATYKVVFDTSLEKFGGKKPKLSGTYKAKKVAMHGFEQSISVKLNGLSAIYLEKVESKKFEQKKAEPKKVEPKKAKAEKKKTEPAKTKNTNKSKETKNGTKK